MSSGPILSRPVDIAAIGATGIERRFAATEAERKALARAYGLREVKALSADLTARPGARGSVIVEGRVTADIVQTCVVSLEPVEQKIDEPVESRFAPEARRDAPSGGEIQVDLDVEDPPEPLLGSSIDLGALAEEYFVLAIDPYPRAAGAEIPPEAGQDPAGEGDSPFAVLAALRDKTRNGR
jgi:uncharacterized metal-binding protein YceD (DUF177 family)